jgi:hypothetical protein
MLPDNFDFAMIPEGEGEFTLKEVGMLSSTIEDIDYAIVSWLKEDLNLSAQTNEGYVNVPVLWQAPERAFQVKNSKDLRDDAGALKLPLISIERTNIVKDPAKKGSFQAHLYSVEKNGRPGRIVIAKRIVQDKTRNFAAASGTRTNAGTTKQKYSPRRNTKVVIQTVSIPIPIYVDIEYKISIKTEYQQQINQLTTPFITRTGQINAFTMKRKGHVYEGFVQQGFSQTNNAASMGEDSRLYSTEITINVLGYLVGDGDNPDTPIARIDENVVEYQFPSESIVPPGNFNLWED